MFTYSSIHSLDYLMGGARLAELEDSDQKTRKISIQNPPTHKIINDHGLSAFLYIVFAITNILHPILQCISYHKRYSSHLYNVFAITITTLKKKNKIDDYLRKLSLTVFLSLWNVKYFVHVWLWLLLVKFQQQRTRNSEEKAQIFEES